METLRDQSQAGLIERAIDFYRLEALLDTLADAEDMTVLTALFDADIASGEDRIGVAARRAVDGIRFVFPVSVGVWDRP